MVNGELYPILLVFFIADAFFLCGREIQVT